MGRQVLALGLSAALLATAPSHLRSEDTCGCSPLETKQWATGGEADPYDDAAVAADAASSPPVMLYTKDIAPHAPMLDDLPLVPSVSQYGITWTFDRPTRAGRRLEATARRQLLPQGHRPEYDH